MAALNVRTPSWAIVYQGKDISDSIAPYVTGLTWVSHAHGRSDDLELALEDREGFWRGAWKPTHGDSVSLKIGYANEATLDCGVFEVESFAVSGPPDVARIRALASGVKANLRSKSSKAYEDTSLKEIAKAIALKHNLTLIGEIEDVNLKRVTQNQEQDLAFLKRIAGQYGYVFSVKGQKLVFSDFTKLRESPSVLSLSRQDVERYSFTDKSLEVFKNSRVSYDDPKSKQNIESAQSASKIDTADTLKIEARCESLAQAERQAKAGLEAANDAKFEGSLTLEGDIRLLAGNTVALIGFGGFDGTYLIEQSRHRIDRSSGYTCELSLKRGAGSGQGEDGETGD